jgi:hypothetical protein
VKLNLALKNRDNDLQFGIQIHHVPCAVNWDARNLLITLKLQSVSLHRCTKQKNVMDPWPAPYQNSNVYWWPQKIWQEGTSNISNLYCFNTVLHQGNLKGRQTTGQSDMLQIPTLWYIIIHVTKNGLALCRSPLYMTKTQNNTKQHNTTFI